MTDTGSSMAVVSFSVPVSMSCLIRRYSVHIHVGRYRTSAVGHASVLRIQLRRPCTQALKTASLVRLLMVVGLSIIDQITSLEPGVRYGYG